MEGVWGVQVGLDEMGKEMQIKRQPNVKQSKP